MLTERNAGDEGVRVTFRSTKNVRTSFLHDDGDNTNLIKSFAVHSYHCVSDVLQFV